jgi:hypothetical protein
MPHGTLHPVRTGALIALGLCATACKPPVDAGDDGGTGTGGEIESAGELSIVRVEANQGVGIDIGVGEAHVGLDARPTGLLNDRPALVRVIHEVTDDWTPRDVRAELELSYDDGTSEVLEHVFRVEYSTNEYLLETSFAWVLERDQVRPDMDYQVRIFDDAVSEGGELIASNPASGPKTLGVGDVDIEMHIALAPIRFKSEDCDIYTKVDAQVIEDFRNHFYQRYPVQRVIIKELPLVTHGVTPVSNLVDVLRQARVDHELSPETHLVGLQIHCESGYSCAPIPWSLAPTSGNGLLRTAYFAMGQSNWSRANESWQPDLDWFSSVCFDTSHRPGFVACGDNEHAPDTDIQYPHERGYTNSWGYGVIDGILRDPMHYDKMAYGCSPQWASDYSWNLAGHYFQKLTALED